MACCLCCTRSFWNIKALIDHYQRKLHHLYLHSVTSHMWELFSQWSLPWRPSLSCGSSDWRAWPGARAGGGRGAGNYWGCRWGGCCRGWCGVGSCQGGRSCKGRRSCQRGRRRCPGRSWVQSRPGECRHSPFQLLRGAPEECPGK